MINENKEEQFICETLGCGKVAVASLDGFKLCYDCFCETKAENDLYNKDGWDE